MSNGKPLDEPPKPIAEKWLLDMIDRRGEVEEDDPEPEVDVPTYFLEDFGTVVNEHQ